MNERRAEALFKEIISLTILNEVLNSNHNRHVYIALQVTSSCKQSYLVGAFYESSLSNSEA